MSTAKALGSLTGRIVTAPVGGKQPCRHPRWGQKRLCRYPRWGQAASLLPSRHTALVAGSPSHTGNPEILAALRAGEPINLAALALPRWARADRGEIHWWHRAIVRPDGGVQFVEDDGEWARENGL
jgi:hypothetical protein